MIEVMERPTDVMESPIEGEEMPSVVTAARQHEMCEPNELGDAKTLWDPSNEEEVKIARGTYDDWKKRGYAVFAIDEADPDKPVLIREFDPKYALLIAKPQNVGG